MRFLFAVLLTPLLLAQDRPSDTPKQRIKLARSMARDGATAIQRLRPMQEDPDNQVRRAAVESIITIGGPQSLDALLFSLGDGDAEIQKLATNGLVNFYLPGYYKTGWFSRLKRTGDQLVERLF